MEKENKIRPCFNAINVSQQCPRSDSEEMEGFGEKAVKLGQALFAWLVLILLLPVLVVVFGPLLIWKYGVVWIIVKIFKRKFIQGFSKCETVSAVDRFWESSRSSLGLIVELEGTIDVENFRDEFRKNVLEYSPNAVESVTEDTPTSPEQSNPEPSTSTSDPPSPETPLSSGSAYKPFAKLAQIPVTFCGYYYWQKANYFLIHEHIRQINQPTDELGLKKAASTLMSLPFPNRRPLWEILVYPNYLGTTTVGRGTTCGSALFIRIHRSLTDSKGLMNILQKMMGNPSGKSICSIKVIADPKPSTAQQAQAEANAELSEQNEGKGVSVIGEAWSIITDKLTNLVFLPLKTFQFTYRIIRVPEGVAKITEEETSDSSNASWVYLQETLIRKICSSQSPPVSKSVVEMSLFLEGITSRGKHKCLNVPDEKGVQSQHSKCQTCVLVPVPTEDCKCKVNGEDVLLTNTRSFVTVKCACVASLQTSANKTVLLKSIQRQFLRNGLDSKSHRQVVKISLGLLSLLPRHILRYLVMSKRWGAGCFIYEQFQLDMRLEDKEKNKAKLFGQYQISQIIPFVGLQWTHTLASAASLQWQDGTLVMSLIANSGIVGSVSQGNPQDHTERIVKGFPEELEKLSDDAEDHGFVSIPIS